MRYNKERYTIEDLVEIVAILRSPDGCPWDRAQDHHSIRKNFIEETYEAIEAIDTKDAVLLEEELGDVLLQIVLHSQMEAERNQFDFYDVSDAICKKLIFRHPHVFGDLKSESSEQALDIWENMKKEEKSLTSTTASLKQVSKALPALMYSEKVQKRASKVGFDYENVSETFGSVRAELDELELAMKEGSISDIEDELGDLLFSTVNLSRFLKIDPEKSLYGSTAKFIGRFSVVERLCAERGIDITEADLSLLDRLWEEAKYISTQQNFGGIINDKS